MKTKAVRLYGEMDLRLDEFELPEMQDDEIMAEVVPTNLRSDRWCPHHPGRAGAEGLSPKTEKNILPVGCVCSLLFALPL